jgi:hypothetical protein
MKWIVRVSVVVLSLIAGVASPSSAQDPPKQDEKKTEVPDISGAWDLTVETQQGPRTVAVTFKVEKEKLTGTMKSPQGDLELEGTITAAEIKFSTTVPTQNGPLTVKFTGEAEKDKLSGTVDFGAGAGTWSAVRPKQ